MIHLALTMALVSQCTAYDNQDFDRGVIIEDHLPKVWLEKDIPLVIILDKNLEGLQSTVEAALGWWNTQLGFNAFVFAGVMDMREGVNINGASPILALSPQYKSIGDTKLLPKVGPISFGMIGVKSSLVKQKRAAFRVLRHELGHLLGLAHDKNPSSIMSAKGNELTGKDRELLKELYNSEQKPTDGSDGRKPNDEGAAENQFPSGSRKLRI